jgi:hypothetical protein
MYSIKIPSLCCVSFTAAPPLTFKHFRPNHNRLIASSIVGKKLGAIEKAFRVDFAGFERRPRCSNSDVQEISARPAAVYLPL